MSKGLVVKDVFARLGGNVILRGVDLHHDGRGTHIVIGRNGSGKTTLARVIAGLVTPQRGSIIFDGVDYTRAPPWERRFAYASAPFPLIEGRTVRGTLEAIARLSGRTDIKEVAERYQISHLLDRMPTQLSQGERQRVGVAAVVLANPRLALFDEPTVHLSRAWAIAISSEILKLSEKEGVPVMLMMPRLEDAMLFGMEATASVLHGGRVVATAPLREHIEAPASIDVIYGLDYHPENIVEIGVGELGKAAEGLCDRGARYAWFRPRDIALGGNGSLKGVVERVVTAGSASTAYVRIGANSLIAVEADGRLSAGSSVGIELASPICFDEGGRRIS